jgi:hypothetical protein
MLVVCIDDSHRPNDIPTSKWIVKGNEYNVIGVYKMNMQNGILGYDLAEINLNGCAPYKYYAASRFKIKELKPEVEAVEKTEEELVEAL